MAVDNPVYLCDPIWLCVMGGGRKKGREKDQRSLEGAAGIFILCAPCRHAACFWRGTALLFWWTVIDANAGEGNE